MKNLLTCVSVAAALSLAGVGAASADTIKVGVVAPFSGPFAIYGKQFKDAIEVYQAEHGKDVAGHTIEFIYKDSGGPNPDQTKSVTQELLIKDQVNYLGGYVFTPNALAIAPLIDQAEVPTVIFNAATSIITAKSNYFVRTSFTLPQNSGPMADWAIENGIKTAVTTVTDYGPGIDAETAFTKEFVAKGGKIVDAIRMPIQTTDFAPFMQRAKAAAPNAVFSFIPAGPPAFSFVKAYSENGLKAAGIRLIGTGDIDDETTLQGLGEGGLGVITSYPYSAAHPGPLNDKFKASYAKLHPDAIVNFASVDAYDGVYVIYKMVEAAGTDGPKAVKSVLGMSWDSPRGPVTIDPVTRTLNQNVYIREVVKGADGTLMNKEIATYPNVPDLGRQ